MGNIEHSEQGKNHPGDSMHPWHDSRIADLEARNAVLVQECYTLTDQLEGAVEAARALGSAWRAGEGDATVGAALARLEDALGLREQGGR